MYTLFYFILPSLLARSIIDVPSILVRLSCVSLSSQSRLFSDY